MLCWQQQGAAAGDLVGHFPAAQWCLSPILQPLCRSSRLPTALGHGSITPSADIHRLCSMHYAVRCCIGKDVFWYNKGKEDMGVTQDELEAVKAREREMMAEVSAVLAY